MPAAKMLKELDHVAMGLRIALLGVLTRQVELLRLSSTKLDLENDNEQMG